MKKLLTTVAAVLLAANTWALDLTNIVRLAANDTNTFTFSASPTYADGIKNVKGDIDPWGMSVAGLYRLTPNVSTGIRADYITSTLFVGSASVTLDLPLKVFGLPVTPMVTGGVGTPVTGAGGRNGDPVFITGAGFYTQVYAKNNWSVGVLYVAERWSNLPGNPTVHRFGAALNLKL